MTTHVREVISFASGADRIEAWHVRPPDDLPRPVVVMAHGLGGTKSMGLDRYAERFVAAGYHCLVFDYRGFGGSTGSPRRVVSIERQLEDWAAAVAHARSLPGVDPAQVVVWGTSLGGGHAIATAARLDGVAAAVAQCPFTDGVRSSLALPTLTSLRLGLRAVADLALSRVLRRPVYVATAGAPGDLALMTAPDALAGYRALAAMADLEPEETRVAARTALEILRYSPGREAADVDCPLFVALCDDDSVAPARRAFWQVVQAPRARVARYPVGHFDIYEGEAFERVVGDTLAFLDAHVPTGRAAA